MGVVFFFGKSELSVLFMVSHWQNHSHLQSHEQRGPSLHVRRLHRLPASPFPWLTRWPVSSDSRVPRLITDDWRVISSVKWNLKWASNQFFFLLDFAVVTMRNIIGGSIWIQMLLEEYFGMDFAFRAFDSIFRLANCYIEAQQPHACGRGWLRANNSLTIQTISN